MGAGAGQQHGPVGDRSMAAGGRARGAHSHA